MKTINEITKRATLAEKIARDRQMGRELIAFADRMGPADGVGVDKGMDRLRTFVEIGIAVLSTLFVVMERRDEAEELVAQIVQTARESADMPDASAEVH